MKTGSPLWKCLSSRPSQHGFTCARWALRWEGEKVDNISSRASKVWLRIPADILLKQGTDGTNQILCREETWVHYSSGWGRRSWAKCCQVACTKKWWEIIKCERRSRSFFSSTSSSLDVKSKWNDLLDCICRAEEACHSSTRPRQLDWQMEKP